MITEKDKKSALLEFIDNYREKDNFESYLIAVLHRVQEVNGYVDEASMDLIAHAMGIPTARIYGVATFYHFFNLKPVGKYIISVCMGTACFVKGANAIADKIKEILNIETGETTKDGLFTLQEARCLGACGQAPVLMINNKIHGRMTPKKTADMIKKIKRNALKQKVQGQR
ncbi:MAG: NADH-quinone oxidoreductase subunit NuoE [Spirochaetales bacterium]|nr:NADH-quinone oxidoreductase subunit NuoE [Spirochaetales bacterium]